jgi:hypothetical protein
MDTRSKRTARRIVVALLLAGGLGGCVYAPPYAAYDPYYPGYGYPTYVGPPVSLDFGFYHHSYRGHHGGHGHGWRGHGRGRGGRH